MRNRIQRQKWMAVLLSVYLCVNLLMNCGAAAEDVVFPEQDIQKVENYAGVEQENLQMESAVFAEKSEENESEREVPQPEEITPPEYVQQSEEAETIEDEKQWEVHHPLDDIPQSEEKESLKDTLQSEEIGMEATEQGNHSFSEKDTFSEEIIFTEENTGNVIESEKEIDESVLQEEEIQILNPERETETTILPQMQQADDPKEEQYAILYSDGTMVFQIGNIPEEKYGTVENIMEYNGGPYQNYSEIPWSTKASQIRSIRFRDHICAYGNTRFYFMNCVNLETIDFTNFDTSDVTDMSYMFVQCKNLHDLDFSPLQTENLNSTAYMFTTAGLKDTDFSTFDTAAVQDMSYMFQYSDCSGVDFSRMNVSALKNARNMFMFASLHGSLDLSEWKMPSSANISNLVGGASMDELYISGWDMKENIGDPQNILHYSISDCILSSDLFISCNTSRLKTFEIIGCSGNGKISLGRFSNCTSLNSFSITGLDLERVDFTRLLYGCENLEYVSFSECNLETVTSLSETFGNCPKLKEIHFHGADLKGLTDIKKSGITKNHINLKYVDFSEANLSGLGSASEWFADMPALERVSFHGANLQQVSSLDRMFVGCKKLMEVDFSSAIMGKLKTMRGCFQETGIRTFCFLNVFRDVNLNQVSDLSDFLSGCPLLLDVDFSYAKLPALTNLNHFLYQDPVLEAIDFSHVVFSGLMDCTGLFQGMTQLRYADFSYADFSSVNSMEVMFNRCTSLEGVNFCYLKADALKSMKQMFLMDSSLRDVDFRGMTSVLENGGSLTSLYGMFGGCTSLEKINLTGLNMEKVTDLTAMFADCTSLQTFGFGDNEIVSARIMDGMFYGCRNLTFVDFSKLCSQTSIQSMMNIFNGCGKLRRLRLGTFTRLVGPSQIPYGWEKTEDGTVVADLWSSYNGSSMAGTYVRINTDLNSQDISYLEYDKESQTISAIVETPENHTNIRLSVPRLSRNTAPFPAALIQTNKELEDILREKEGSLAMNIQMLSRTYMDIMGCSESEKVIWTFDVSKDNHETIRMDLYSQDGFYGYIENTKTEPLIFTFYSSDGTVLDILKPGQRHTYGDIGFHTDLKDIRDEDGNVIGTEKVPATVNGKYIDQETEQKYVYPEYNQYLTYDQNMENYEVAIEPGHYRIDTVFYSTEADSLKISGSIKKVPVENSEGENGSPEMMDVFVPSYYTFHISSPDRADFELSLFNDIKKDTDSAMEAFSVATENFIKKDALTKIGVPGAIYKFTSRLNGRSYYGMTDENGRILSYMMGITSMKCYADLYDSIDNVQKKQGQKYEPKLRETFVVQEVIAPEGYYLNPERKEITFWSDYQKVEAAASAELIYRDAVTIRSDSSSVCETCMTGAKACLCFDFGNCRCKNCVLGSLKNQTSADLVEMYDVPWPNLKIRKLDEQRLDLSGAILQLIEKRTGKVIYEWESDGTAMTYLFNTSEHAAVEYGKTKTFLLHEKKAPEGYLPAKDMECTVKWDDGFVTLNMVDQPKIKPVELPCTGGKGIHFPFYQCLLLNGVWMISAYIRRKKLTVR